MSRRSVPARAVPARSVPARSVPVRAVAVRAVPVLGVAALLLAAGCTASPAPPSGADRPAVTQPAADGGALDTVAGSLPVPERGTLTTPEDVAVGPDGEPVLLFAVDVDAGGPLAVVRPTARDGWAEVVLDAYDRPIRESGLDVAPDGTVVVAGWTGGSVAVSRIAPDGTVSTVAVTAGLRPDTDLVSATALSPDGTTLYLAVHRVGEPLRLLAVDAGTGAVTVERVVPSTGQGSNRADAIAVAADGTVFVGLDTHTAPEGAQTAELARFSPALEPAGTVPLLPGTPAYDVRRLAVTPEGAAVLVVHDGAIGDEANVLALVLVAPGAATATRVATVSEEQVVDSLAVDPEGRFAYLGGLRQPIGADAVTVTAVDLATGRAGPGVPLCAGSSVDALVVPDAGGPAFAAVTCDDARTTELVTLT
ncbi:SMP-30/gluconolactonase/LRE family protein [Trujillonella humicola]|uniref:SMP-30/gluconolactonase/LRE family protein n=1 Tax=Trujillonella humicola TaxID=3383699 RepID=UPI003906BEFD